MEAQNRMRKANILLVNFSSVGAEIAKNLVLGGIGSLTILDSTKVRNQDLGCNFFFDRNSVGQFKASAASHRVQELNKMVKLSIDTESFETKNQTWFEQFDIIIGTMLRRQEIVELNKVSRKCEIPFYATTSHGLYGYIFVDLVEHDSNVKTISNNIPKQLGKTSSVREILRIDKLTENDTSVDNCIVRNFYKPFSELGSSPEVFIKENFPLKRKLRKMKPVLLLLLSLLEYSDVNAMEIGIDEIDIDVDDLKAKAKAWAEKLTLPQHVVDDDAYYCKELARQAFTEFQPVAAVLGGCVAQDVINMLGRRENPLNNFVVFNAAEEALLAGLAVCAPLSSSTDAFNLNPGYAGPYSTGAAPILVNTDAAPAVTGVPTKAHNLPNPIETELQSPDHKDGDESIYRLMGNQSPYSPSDFGVYNFGMPEQCRVKQLHYVGRHGSRYPDSTPDFAETLENATFKASGELEFLNNWENTLGQGILTHLGRQQLFDHGVAQYFRYGALFDDQDKLVVRSTSQQRMKESAMYFLSGFFGLEWEKYANLELLIEDYGQNNTLSWTFCPNNDESYILGYDLTPDFIDHYLANATDRFNDLLEGNLTLTSSDVMSMQAVCAYETSSFGSSKFCPLFTQKEWEDYEYALDYLWYASNSFSNPTGRAMGVGWVVEFYQRLTNTPYDPATQTSENSTINSNPTYFPTDQSLYFDFTHDSTLISIVTALGLNQFRSNFTGDGVRQPFVLSHVVPFGAFFNFEVIECDEQVPADRSSQKVEGSKKTEYIHLIMNDSTVSLSINLPDVCESRADGWCELDKFIDYLSTLYEESQYEKSCFGDIDIKLVSNGVPE